MAWGVFGLCGDAPNGWVGSSLKTGLVIKLDPRTLQLIHEYKRRKIRWVYLLVGWAWKDQDRIERGHASILVIDTVKKTYAYFDPNSGNMYIVATRTPHPAFVNRYDLLENPHNILIPGYSARRDRQNYGMSVQSVISSHAAPSSVAHAVPGGLCSPICFLIIMLCHRYAMGYPWKFADAICSILDDQQPSPAFRENFRSNLVHWWKNMYGGDYKKLEKMVGLRNPQSAIWNLLNA